MRAFITLVAAICVALGAQNPQERIQSLLDSKKIPAKVVSTQDLGHNLRAVVVEHTQNGERIMLFSSSDGAVLFNVGELMWSEDNAFLGKLERISTEFEKAQKARVDSAALELFNTHKDAVMSFKAKKPTTNTLYIISDPMCPYCLKELENLPSRLESSNVKMLVVGFLGEDSLKKASEILSQKSSDERKNLALLQKIYDKNYKPKDTKNPKVLEISQAVAQAGVHSVPYLIESK
ncbi:hypothetical protein [uncultured Helicobacter sp.]|uniref:hypothetical protein n=1 Tax=uncultured Helicobacter sp. TaxID=175537 RepID=UPI003750CE1E